jgi:PRTRC genetic system protein B
MWLPKYDKMKNVAAAFNNIYLPKKALVVYQSLADENGLYVEAYDMDVNGKRINAHPLSVKETIALAEVLNTCTELSNDFLISKGLLPENVLHVNAKLGYAVWHTPEQKVNLLFKKELGIACGEAFIPAMVWKARKDSLYVYAMKESKRPTGATKLYFAPFFNIHGDGNVCMGTVNIEIDKHYCLEDFIKAWEDYFFNSYFSHLIGNYSPTKGNIVQLWKGLVGTDRKFPNEVLIKNGKQIKDLLQ